MSVLETIADYEALTAEDLVAQVVRAAKAGSVCVTSSFQTEDMVVLHMLRQHVPDVPVIFLETGYHFEEVIEYRDRMTKEWG
jgi:phosphoadenosine phosphosulfate reductase